MSMIPVTFKSEREAVEAALELFPGVPVVRTAGAGQVHLWREGYWRLLSRGALTALRAEAPHVEVWRSQYGWHLDEAEAIREAS